MSLVAFDWWRIRQYTCDLEGSVTSQITVFDQDMACARSRDAPFSQDALMGYGDASETTPTHWALIGQFAVFLNAWETIHVLTPINDALWTHDTQGVETNAA